MREVLGAGVPIAVERTADGVSTPVYRVRRGAQTTYLRLAEEAHHDLGADAELHRRLRGLGVRVPGVLHVRASDARVGRSVLLTTEVPGVSLAEVRDRAVAARVVADAGADLAVLNGVAVDGFGFVRREGARWPLQAEHPTHAAFVVEHLPDPWPGPLAGLFDVARLDRLAQLVSEERARALPSAVLAHGDADVTPVFCRDGRYTGLIDLGEARGAEAAFDLGHFLLHDGETLPWPLLPDLLRGYASVRPPPAAEQVHRSAVLLGLRQLCRWLGPPRSRPLDHPAVLDRARRLRALLAGA
nr:phosphotransferase [Kineococcus siccus]